jgi:hypothetical protein
MKIFRYQVIIMKTSMFCIQFMLLSEQIEKTVINIYMPQRCGKIHNKDDNYTVPALNCHSLISKCDMDLCLCHVKPHYMSN